MYLNDLGLLCNLGDCQSVEASLLEAGPAPPEPRDLFHPRGDNRVARVTAELPPLPGRLRRFDCRNNRLAAAALDQIAPAVNAALARYGAARVGVVMATSTSGIEATQGAVTDSALGRPPPADFDPVRGFLGGLGEFAAGYLGLDGPVYTLSTACSSSANALLSARRLLALGLCDAVVAGGVDTLCELTLRGFGALEAQSASYNAPFAADRDGINIGEAAALFLVSREPAPLRLLGGGVSSDAHHMSAPHPEGEGALRAMREALQNAGLAPGDIDYLNLHGTGTIHNDAMEALAVHRLFGDGPRCSSTKAFTGHTLGAAGALELGICWLLLKHGGNIRLPPSLYADRRDPALAPIGLTGQNERPTVAVRHCMSNSFAFGGSNVSLIVGRTID